MMIQGTFPAFGAAFALALVLALGACSTGTDDTTDGRLRIVTTVSPITNLVQNISGDKATVTGLVPEGQNSHEFEPKPSDARAVSQADLIFINGLHLEEPSRKLAEANRKAGARIIQLANETITEAEYIYDFSFPRAQGDPNPHLWTHPLHAKRYAELIRNALKQKDPANAGTYDGNYDEIAQRFDALDRALKEATATVPAASRKLLTYHDSFPYMARAYGWTVVGAIQPSDFSEPSPRDVARLIDQIRDNDVPAIFGSEVFPSDVLAQIARETGARYVDELRDDDLPGNPRDAGHSLLGLLVFDFRTIVSALGGDPSAFDTVDTRNIASGSTVEYRQ